MADQYEYTRAPCMGEPPNNWRPSRDTEPDETFDAVMEEYGKLGWELVRIIPGVESENPEYNTPFMVYLKRDKAQFSGQPKHPANSWTGRAEAMRDKMVAAGYVGRNG